MRRTSSSCFGCCVLFFCLITTLMLPTFAVADDIISGRIVRASIQELDLLDQVAVDLLSGKSELFPNLSKRARNKKISDIERALDLEIASAYSELRLNTSEITVLSGLHVNVLQRRILGNKPLKTNIKHLSERAECKQDLALGRTLVRYSRALSKRNEAELFLVLMDYQNALNCISGMQARLLAHATGVALWEWMDRFESLDLSEKANEVAIASILNPALMIFDLAKYQGPNWLYYALLKAEANSPKASDRLSKLYFYDFITGSLVSMVPRGAISVAPLLDPENIGTGMCSLLEMVGAGGETGDFACGRGISCSANNMNNVPNLGQGTELIPNNSVLGNAADNSFLGDRGQLFDNLGANFQGETTPYGIPVSSLSGNCEGAGTSAAGIGQLANSPGFSSFSGCLATALAAAAQDNTGSCIIRASQAIASQQPTTIFGTGRNGLPVVRGVLGDSSCQSDPLAQGGGKPLTSGQFASDCRTFYACGKEGAADFFRSQAGVEFTKQLLHDAADAWADRLGDINSIGSGSRTLTPDQQAAVDAAHDQADAEAGNLAEEGAKAVEDSKQKAGLASKEKDAGQTRGSDIVVDKGLPDTKSNQAVLEHEAAHAILNKFFTGKGGSSGVDHHEVMKQQPGTYYDRWAQMMEDAKSWIEEQLNPSKDEEEDTPPSDDQDQTQTPKPDEGYCTALSESMKTLMACTNPIEFPFEAPGGLSPETVILPERADGPTFLTPLPDDDGFAKSEAAAASMFGECYAQFGMNVLGVDKKGNLIIGGTADLSSNRCGALDCTPPSVAKPVNGFCQCVGDGPDIGRIYREMGHKRLCATSDACIPRIDIFSTLDNLLEPDPGF